MKNKHLVLLFLITVVVGLALRNAPWKDSPYFQRNLLRGDTSDIVRLECPELVLVRTEAGWVAEQQNRSASVPEAEITPILSALANLRSIRMLNLHHPDSCGLNPGEGIPLVVHYNQHKTEHLLIGKEILEQGRRATYLSIKPNRGIFLVENPLRGLFSKSLDDFRKAAVVGFSHADVRAFMLETHQADTMECRYDKNTDRWHLANTPRSISSDSVFAWLSLLEKLPKLPFADLFDETHEGKQLYSRIRLDKQGSPDSLWVYIYRLNTMSVPEEFPDLQPNDPRLAPYALYFSSYPTNYYALSDTIFLRQICQPF